MSAVRSRSGQKRTWHGTANLVEKDPGRVKTFFFSQKLHAAGRNRRDRLSLFLLYRVRSQSGRNLGPRRTTELCKRHPALVATVLELPGAVDRATEIAKREGLGAHVQHRIGNALSDDLGEATFDIVMINNLVHHFTPEQNAELARRAARALAPGGVYAVGDFLRRHIQARAAACRQYWTSILR